MNQEFLQWVQNWTEKLPSRVFEDFDEPEKIAVISVDMVNGFCHKGALASKEVEHIIPNVVNVFKKAKNYGVNHFLLLEDAHSQNAEEFTAYPPHCIKGTEESETIPEIANLSFAKEFQIFKKNAWSPAYDTTIDTYIKDHHKLDTFILIGDCTDICVYAMALHLRMQSFANNIKRRIIVVANSVATYDMPIKTAEELKVMPHDAKTLHAIFLYHMALNAIEVIKEIK
ncbi:MAG TPA: isochorismatase family cysteine hydrolase [Patescibacteria group bacterium]